MSSLSLEHSSCLDYFLPRDPVSHEIIIPGYGGGDGVPCNDEG